MAEIQLIAGLGNPGTRYAATRHNAGFDFADRVCAARGLSFRREARFSAEVASADIAGHRVWIIKPLTYMNLSGAAVAAFAAYYRIAPDAMLVAHDELDLAPGTVRLKTDGGHGGHNGLRDIIAHLNTRAFNRLRIGIGHPGPGGDVVGWVLKPPPAEEAQAIADAIDLAHGYLDDLAGDRFDYVMSQLNRRVDDNSGASA